MLASLEAAAHCFGVSQLTWTECLVLPFRNSDARLRLEHDRFLLTPLIKTVPLIAAVYHRAAMIRGKHSYGLADSLHLATAVEYRFDRFLTHDQSLAGFTDVAVELLP